MKNFTVRAFVLALALTGAAATAHSSKTTGHVLTTSAQGLPLPVCSPNDPNGCGIN